MNKKTIIILSLVLLILVFGFIIPKETKPSANTRIILEHQYQTYVAPRCFEQADVTNYLEDATLGKAKDLHYNAHDLCTENELKADKDPFFISLLKDIGLLKKKWDNW